MADIGELAKQLEQLYLRFAQFGPTDPAHEQLMQIYKNPENIEPMIFLAQNTQNPQVKATVFTGISTLIRQTKKYPEPYKSGLFDRLLPLVTVAPTPQLQLTIIDRLLKLQADNLTDEERDEVLIIFANFAMQITENANLLPGALHFWDHIIHYSQLHASFGQYLVETILPLALNMFHSESEIHRCAAYEFIFHSLGEYIEFLQISEDIQAQISEAIINQVDFIIQQSINENQVFFNAFSEMYLDIFESHDLVFPIIYKIIAVLQDTEISSDIRRMLIQPMSAIIHMQADELVDEFEAMLSAMVQFTYQLAQENQDEMIYADTTDFYLEIIRGLEDCCGNSFEILSPQITQLLQSEDPNAFLVAFMILTAILPDSPDTVVELYNDLEEIVEVSLTSEIPTLFDAAVNFLEVLVSVNPSIAPHIQEKFEAILLQCIQNQRVLTLLAVIYRSSETAPENPEASIETLIQVFSATTDSYHHELTFTAIAELVKILSDAPEGLYQKVKPIINELITSGSAAIGSALIGFSSFALCDPTAVAPDLEEMCKILLQALTMKDKEIVSGALVTAVELFQVFPTSLAGLAPQFFAESLRIANLLPKFEFGEEEEDENPEDELGDENRDDENEYDKFMSTLGNMSGHGLMLAGFLFNLYAENLAEQADELVEIWMAFENIENVYGLFYLYQMSHDLIEGLVKIGKDPSEIIRTMFGNFASNEDQDVRIKLWEDGAYAIRNIPAEVVAPHAQYLFEIIIGILMNKVSIYCRQNEPERLESIFVKPLMNCITELFMKLGASAAQLTLTVGEDNDVAHGPLMDKLKPAFLKLNNDKNPIIRSCAAMTTAYIATFFPEDAELMQGAAEMLIRDIESSYNDVKVSLFQGFNYLMWMNRDILREAAPQIMQSAIDMVKSTDVSNANKFDAAVVWGSIVELYEVTPSMEDLAAVINVLPGPAHDYQLKYNAHFVLFVLNRWPEAIQGEPLLINAVTIIGSDDKLLAILDKGEAAALANVISQADPAIVAAMAKNMELQLHYIEVHTAQLLQPQQ